MRIGVNTLSMLFLAVAVAAGEGQEVQVKSTLDGEMQPCILYVPTHYDKDKATPLLVMLHSWGGSYKEKGKQAIPEAEKRGWLCILPNYRNGNKTPKACGSKYAVQDIIDAVNYVKASYTVDATRIYLLGGSGGGHMSLVMAAKHPDLWAAVSSWCPITDLKKWYEENLPANSKAKRAGFSSAVVKNLEAVCGGPPGTSEEVDREYQDRSPVTFIEKAKDLTVQIVHGKEDDLVAVHHAEDAYKKLMDAGAKNATFVLHEGGHMIDVPKACAWLEQFQKK